MELWPESEIKRKDVVPPHLVGGLQLAAVLAWKLRKSMGERSV